MHVAALLGGGSPKEVELLARYGRILGTLAALREEFIDIFEIEELNQRIKAEALPIPILYALQDKGPTKIIEKLLTKGELNSQDIERLLDIVMRSESVERLRTYMLNLNNKANNLASNIQNQAAAKLLRTLAESTLEDL